MSNSGDRDQVSHRPNILCCQYLLDLRQCFWPVMPIEPFPGHVFVVLLNYCVVQICRSAGNALDFGKQAGKQTRPCMSVFGDEISSLERTRSSWASGSVSFCVAIVFTRRSYCYWEALILYCVVS